MALRSLQDKLDRLEAGDILVISGSVPAALSHDVYEQILARLEDRGIQFVVDSTRDVQRTPLSPLPYQTQQSRAG